MKIISGKVPSCDGVQPARAVPPVSVKAALMLLSAACAIGGLPKPEMVKVMGEPEENVPLVRLTVNVEAPVETDPIAPEGDWNMTLGFENVNPPEIVMTSLLPLGTSTAGVSVTLIVTAIAIATLLLSVMAGSLVPKHCDSTETILHINANRIHAFHLYWISSIVLFFTIPIVFAFTLSMCQKNLFRFMIGKATRCERS